MDEIILDASVLIKLFYPGEQDKTSDNLIEKFAKKELSFVTLDLALYEFVNALKFSKNAKKDFIFSALAGILDMDPKIISYSSLLMEKILDIIDNFPITVYDASFVAASEMQRISLLTADYKHHKKEISKYILHYREWKR